MNKLLALPFLYAILLTSCTKTPTETVVVHTKKPEARLTPTTFCERMTEEMLAKDFPDWVAFDPGFTKYLVVFRAVPETPPYSIVMKRIAQNPPGKFLPHPVHSGEHIAKSKQDNSPVGFFLSEKGFLPGEKVTLRITSGIKSEFYEVGGYLRPLRERNAAGKTMLEARLISAWPAHYSIIISEIAPGEEVEFVSTSAHESFSHVIPEECVIDGACTTSYMPEVVGVSGGIAKIEVRRKDGSSHKLELPWGDEFLPYLQGEK